MKKVNLQELRKQKTELIDTETINKNSLFWVIQKPFRHQYVGGATEISILKDISNKVEYFFVQHGGLDGIDSYIVPVKKAKSYLCYEFYYGEKNDPVIAYIFKNYKLIIKNDKCMIS